MTLYIDSDEAYLVEPKGKSRAAGYFYLSTHYNPKLNGPMYCLCTLIKAVMLSVPPSELGALFIKSTHAIPIRNTLISMGYHQPPTPIKTDNTTALGVVPNTTKRKRTKSIDMRFYWVRDRMNKKNFVFTGYPAKKIEMIIIPSTIYHPTINS